MRLEVTGTKLLYGLSAWVAEINEYQSLCDAEFVEPQAVRGCEGPDGELDHVLYRSSNCFFGSTMGIGGSSVPFTHLVGGWRLQVKLHHQVPKRTKELVFLCLSWTKHTRSAIRRTLPQYNNHVS